MVSWKGCLRGPNFVSDQMNFHTSNYNAKEGENATEIQECLIGIY